MRLLIKYLDMDEKYVRGLCDIVLKEMKVIVDDLDRLSLFVVKLCVMVGRKLLVFG